MGDSVLADKDADEESSIVQRLAAHELEGADLSASLLELGLFEHVDVPAAIAAAARPRATLSSRRSVPP